MKRSTSLLITFLMLTMGLAGCLEADAPVTSDGDELVLGESPDDWPTYHVPSASDLPACPGANNEHLGKLYYVEDVTEFQACASGGWETVDFTVPVNHPPRVEASVETNDDWHVLGWSDPTAEWMYRGVLMWSAVDPEGEAVSVGVDHDRDGVVDVQLPRAEGRVVDETTGMLAIPWNGSIVVERVAEYGEGCHLSFTRFFDVIATDASGNAATYTVQTGAIESNSFYRNLMEAEVVADGDAMVYFGNYVTQDDVDWVTGVATGSPCTPSNNNNGGGASVTYLFTFEDHPSSTSTSTSDPLARVTFTQGSSMQAPTDLEIRLAIDGSGWMVCVFSAAGDGSDLNGASCFYGGINDGSWDVGDSIVVGEGQTDLCTDGASCSVDIQILDGNEAFIAQMSGIVE